MGSKKMPPQAAKGGENVKYRSNVIRFISHADCINEEFVHLAKAHKKAFDALNKFQSLFPNGQGTNKVNEALVQLEKAHKEFLDASSKLQFLFVSNQATVTLEFREKEHSKTE